MKINQRRRTHPCKSFTFLCSINDGAAKEEEAEEDEEELEEEEEEEDDEAE